MMHTNKELRKERGSIQPLTHTVYCVGGRCKQNKEGELLGKLGQTDSAPPHTLPLPHRDFLCLRHTPENRFQEMNAFEMNILRIKYSWTKSKIYRLQNATLLSVTSLLVFYLSVYLSDYIHLSI